MHQLFKCWWMGTEMYASFAHSGGLFLSGALHNEKINSLGCYSDSDLFNKRVGRLPLLQNTRDPADNKIFIMCVYTTRGQPLSGPQPNNFGLMHISCSEGSLKVMTVYHVS